VHDDEDDDEVEDASADGSLAECEELENLLPIVEGAELRGLGGEGVELVARLALVVDKVQLGELVDGQGLEPPLEEGELGDPRDRVWDVVGVGVESAKEEEDDDDLPEQGRRRISRRALEARVREGPWACERLRLRAGRERSPARQSWQSTR
jgi:hypothetical protein